MYLVNNNVMDICHVMNMLVYIKNKVSVIIK